MVVRLCGKHPERGRLWAYVDPDAKEDGRVAETRIGAFVRPFPTVVDAQAALAAAGATLERAK